jgi:excisionase family DNA binding protein
MLKTPGGVQTMQSAQPAECAPTEPLLTAEEVAVALGKSARTVHRMIKSGEIGSVQVPALVVRENSRRIPQSDLDAYRAAQTAQSDATAWAAKIAPTMPPLMQEEAAAVARIATAIDARAGHEADSPS